MRSAAAIPRRAAFVRPTRAEVSWATIYISATLVVWTVSPFFHRVTDWKAHFFSGISPFGALPLIVLVPAAAMLFAGRVRRINKSYELVALLWTVGFSYALLIAFLAGHLLGGIFTFVSFCLPLGFGLWVATRVEDTEILYRKISQTCIVLAFIAGIYGIIQYVVLPPWDAAWMQTVAMTTNGVALPFQVRVFSMLNSPGTFGAFLTFATIMFLPRLTLKSGFLLLPIFISLGLSMLRAAWVTLPLSIIIFALLTTRRAQLLKGVAVFFGIGLLAVGILQITSSVGVGSVLQNRLLTLTDIAHDVSAEDRANQMNAALKLGIDEPEGNGLGFVGTATRLNSTQEAVTNLDSGYLSRFVEMGFPGVAAFIASLSFAMFSAIRVWRTSVRNGDGKMQDLAALAITMQVALLALNIFVDADVGFAAILAWTSLGLILRSPAPKRSLQ